MNKSRFISYLIGLGIIFLFSVFWLGVLFGAEKVKEDYLVLNGVNNTRIRFDGYYFPITQDILIHAKGRSLNEVLDTAYHEAGHYAYAEILSGTQKRKYGMIYDQSNIKFNNSLYRTHYEESDFEKEDFVRSFACWSLNTCELDDDRRQFFEENLGISIMPRFMV